MYVIKVGECYVKNIKSNINRVTNTISISEVVLSSEIVRGYKKLDLATIIAKKVNGKVIEMTDVITIDEEKYKQLSLFDKEVQNNANT